jgi:hypothetical protein
MATEEGKRDSTARIQILVAIIGVVGVIAAAVISNWSSIFPKPAATQTTSSNAPASNASAAPEKKPPKAVYSKGQLMVRGTWHCDLDEGAETASKGDFWWKEDSTVKRYLTPEDGAVFNVMGVRDFDSLTFAELEHLSYSDKAIDGSDVTTENDLPKGTVVAYRTKQGRLGKFVVDTYGHNLTIRWTTYQK